MARSPHVLDAVAHVRRQLEEIRAPAMTLRIASDLPLQEARTVSPVLFIKKEAGHAIVA